MAIADVFDGVRELGRRARGSYDNANLWIGPELRESDDWHDFCSRPIPQLMRWTRRIKA